MMTCQYGTERFLKQEILERYHDLRVAFSRPGFVTFKATPDWDAKRVGKIRSIFARYKGLSLGRMASSRTACCAESSVWEMVKDLRVDRVHVFPRDPAVPGDNGFEPHIDRQCIEIHNQLYNACPYRERLASGADDALCPAERREVVLDVAQISEDEWYVGWHIADDWRSCQPGGIVNLQRPFDSVSRAYLKFEEGLRWSGFPVHVGSHWLDIGAAPGGASQALLARGAEVVGVDPADISPVLTQNPNFRHLRGRLNQLKRSHFRKVRWVVTDMNVAPNYTLDVLEDFVTQQNTNIRGLLFTLKLVKWDLVADISDYTQRIKSWGYTQIALAQMQFNRQEIMVAVRK
jgi:23S rRNA (cytidine2498-2'-O)-methyltransferase